MSKVYIAITPYDRLGLEVVWPFCCRYCWVSSLSHELRRYDLLIGRDRRCEDAQMSCGCEEVRYEDLRCEDTWM